MPSLYLEILVRSYYGPAALCVVYTVIKTALENKNPGDVSVSEKKEKGQKKEEERKRGRKSGK